MENTFEFDLNQIFALIGKNMIAPAFRHYLATNAPIGITLPEELREEKRTSSYYTLFVTKNGVFITSAGVPQGDPKLLNMVFANGNKVDEEGRYDGPEFFFVLEAQDFHYAAYCSANTLKIKTNAEGKKLSYELDVEIAKKTNEILAAQMQSAAQAQQSTGEVKH